jgi:phosphonate transport system substrate-binding protein
MIKKLLVTLAGTALIAINPVAAQELKEITFGIISTESTAILKAAWDPLLADMSKKTGLNVKAFLSTDYAGVIEGMRFNKVQVAWHGNKSAMEAVDRANSEIFAKMINLDGTEGYYSHFIVHRDSPIQSMDEVLKNGKNYSFGAGDPNSTSGFLVPGYYVFAKNHIDPKTHFKSMRIANHETNTMAVINKQVDVAVSNSEQLDRTATNLPEKRKEVRVIWTSPLIPADPLLYRKDLPDATKAKIKDFFVNYGMNDPHEKAVLAKLKLSGFKASSNAQLTPIRELDLFSKHLKAENDANLSAADKQAKLAELDKQLAALAQAK